MDNLEISIKSFVRVLNGDEVNARAVVEFNVVERMNVTAEIVVAGDDGTSLRELELAALEKAHKVLGDLAQIPASALYPTLQATRRKYDIQPSAEVREALEGR